MVGKQTEHSDIRLKTVGSGFEYIPGDYTCTVTPRDIVSFGENESFKYN